MLRNRQFHNDSVPRDMTAGEMRNFRSERTLEVSAVWESTEVNISPCFIFIGCVEGFIVIISFLGFNVCAAATDGHSVSAGHWTSQVEMSPKLQTSLSFITIITDPQNRLSKIIYSLQGLSQWHFCVGNKTLAVLTFTISFFFFRIVTVGFLLFAKTKIKIGK